MLGFWPVGDPGKYSNYYPFIHGSWVIMELATILTAALALRFVRFGFLVAPMAFSFWFFSLDIAALLARVHRLGAAPMVARHLIDRFVPSCFRGCISFARPRAAHRATILRSPKGLRNCPRDRDIVMMRYFWSVKRQVTSDPEREKAARQYYRQMFAKELARMLRQDKAKMEKARRIANIFKYICPSYYLPGKQDWGAF